MFHISSKDWDNLTTEEKNELSNLKGDICIDEPEPTAIEKVVDAVFKAFIQCYNIPDPRNDEDGPDIDFSSAVEEAVHEYVDTLVENNDFDLAEILTIIGNNPDVHPNK